MRRLAPLATLVSAAVLTTSCTDVGPMRPDGLTGLGMPSATLLDGSTDPAHGGFYFLPPLVKQPVVVGTFNPNLLPEMSVCLLGVDAAGQPTDACDPVQPPNLAYFGPGSADVADDHYQISWDTDDPRWTTLDPSRNYRITVSLADNPLGHMDVNPQNPSGSTPGEDFPGLYAFRNGETLPVKFWISHGFSCVASGSEVIECNEGSATSAGGDVELPASEGGNALGVTLFEDAVGGPVTVIVERIDPDELPPGEGCIPLLDAPLFGDCFRVRTIPEIAGEELGGLGALISICIDPAAFGLTNGSVNRPLQIFHYHDGDGEFWEALRNVQTPVCSGPDPSQTAMFDVPERGFLRYVALGVNAAARFLGPQPLAAAHLGLGGMTGSFSRFQWALPGEMSWEGDNPATVAADVFPVTVLVEDEVGLPVAGATVHFSGDFVTGTPSATTDSDGHASFDWDLSAGQPNVEYTLDANAFGLLSDAPDHETSHVVEWNTITLTARVCPTPTVDGTWGGGEWSCAENATFVANISGGSTPASVYWMNTADSLYLAVRVQQSEFDKANSLRVDFDRGAAAYPYVPGVHSEGDDAIGFQVDDPYVPTGHFFDEHLTKKCANSGQSGCGEADGSTDGAGAAGNAGGWTTYELSHPLDDGSAQDFALGVGDQVGFFLTLRIGNGAHGNTQWPGFRIFQPVVVR